MSSIRPATPGQVEGIRRLLAGRDLSGSGFAAADVGFCLDGLLRAGRFTPAMARRWAAELGEFPLREVAPNTCA